MNIQKINETSFFPNKMTSAKWIKMSRSQLICQHIFACLTEIHAGVMD